MKEIKKYLIENSIIISSIFVFGLVIGIFMPNFGAPDKKVLEENINNILLQGKIKGEITKITPVGNLFKVDVKVTGQNQPIYVDKKSKVFYSKFVDLDELEKQKKAEAESNIVKNKTNKPKVELFIMSYCPYGTQTEKGYLPAVEKLGDKIDAKIKFVNYAMHPNQGEVQENLLQYCIQEEQPKKYNSYLSCFLDKGNSKDCLNKNNLDKNSGKLKTCISETDKEFKITKNLNDKKLWLNGRFPKFLINNNLNEKYGVKGSPTLIINGQKMEKIGRDADSIFKAICSAFKTQPEVCKQSLDTNVPTAGFGYNGVSNNNSAGDCGV